MVHLINKDSLEESHKRLDGSKATGVDKVTKAEYDVKLETNLTELVKRMKRQGYKPQPAKRVYIAKVGSDKMRPLGMQSYEDKLVQNVIAQILNENQTINREIKSEIGRTLQILRGQRELYTNKKVQRVYN